MAESVGAFGTALTRLNDLHGAERGFDCVRGLPIDSSSAEERLVSVVKASVRLRALEAVSSADDVFLLLHRAEGQRWKSECQ